MLYGSDNKEYISFRYSLNSVLHYISVLKSVNNCSKCLLNGDKKIFNDRRDFFIDVITIIAIDVE